MLHINRRESCVTLTGGGGSNTGPYSAVHRATGICARIRQTAVPKTDLSQRALAVPIMTTGPSRTCANTNKASWDNGEWEPEVAGGAAEGSAKNCAREFYSDSLKQSLEG